MWLLGLFLGCAAEKDGCPNAAHPGVHYESTDLAYCATAFYVCDLDQERFPVEYFECGCGCIDAHVVTSL